MTVLDLPVGPAVRHRVAVGRRIVLVTNNDDAYRTATVLRSHGISAAGAGRTVAGSAHFDNRNRGALVQIK